MADPFDVTDSNANYQPTQDNSGSSPDFYRNLLNFGLATMAAGAKPGATTLGALGQGGISAMDSARQNAQARTQQQLYQQDIYSKQISNAQQLFQAQRRNSINSAYGLPTMNLANMPGMINNNAAPQQVTAQNISIGSSKGIGASPATDSLSSETNADALNAYRQQNNLQTPIIDKSQGISASSPSSMTDNAGNVKQESSGQAGMQFSPTAGMSTNSSNPTINSYTTSNGMTNAQIAQMLMYKPDQLASIIQNGDSNTAMRAVSIAQQIGITAPSYLTKMAESYAELPAAIAKEEQIPKVVPQGSVLTRNGNPYYQNPVQIKTVAQSGNDQGLPVGTPLDTFATPAITSSSLNPSTSRDLPSLKGNIPVPPTPAQIQNSNVTGPTNGNMTFPTGLSPQQEQFLKEGLGKEEQDKYESAQQALAQTQAIQNSMNKLSNGGWVGMGTLAEERADAAKALNTASSILGFKGEVFDPEKVASSEEFNKQATALSFNMVKQLGSRESMMAINMASKSNPNVELSPTGGQLLNATTAEAAQREVDKHEYMTQQVQAGIPQAQAEIQFNKQNPISNYVDRATSQIQPLPIKNEIRAKSLLPGTKFVVQRPDGSTITDNGQPFMVPIPQGVSVPSTVNK